MFFRSHDKEIGRLASLLAVTERSTIADFGAGKGRFSAAFSKIVGADGKIYAVEADPKLIDKLNDRVATDKLANVTVVQSTETNSNLAALSCDAIFARFSYHHFSQPAAMDASLFDAVLSNLSDPATGVW